MAIKHNSNQQVRRARRNHARVVSTSERPKMVITRSNKAIYLQVINPEGKVVVASSDVSLIKTGGIKEKMTKTAKAELVGQDLGKKIKAAKIKAVSVDRGAYKYHGRLKAAVEAVKAAGVEI